MIVRWSAEANEDRVAIFDFIELDKPGAAYRIDERVLQVAEQIGSFPGIGRPGRISGTREMAIHGTPYLLIYCINQDHIMLLHILHGAQQWPDVEPE